MTFSYFLLFIHKCNENVIRWYFHFIFNYSLFLIKCQINFISISSVIKPMTHHHNILDRERTLVRATVGAPW